MSAPVMNAVLPPPSAPSPPVLAQPLSLSVPAIKPAPPSPPSIKPQTNHIAPVPISLVQEIKIKAPEKPKDLTSSPPKPTSNGTEEPQPLKPPVISVPEVVPSPPIPASLPVPAVPSTVVAAAAPEPAVLTLATTPTAPPAAIPSAASVPTPVAAPAPPSINQAAEPPSEAEAPATPEPEPAEAAPPPESAKPKAAKPQAAKRRRELPPASSAPVVEEGVPEKLRRMRAPVNPYQSPLPEIMTVINRSVRDNSQKSNDEKLIVFYKNEFLAVRNAEGSFYLCQTMQNIFRTSHKIRIRWLSRDEKESTDTDGIYTRDFYDSTDFECILTTVALQKKDSNKYKMPAAELERVESILKRALDVEKGVSEKPDVTEEHPDGLDLSLYRNESQLQKSKKAAKRKSSTKRKSSSPKRAKKTKQKKSPSVSKKVEKAIAPAKVKTPARKTPAKKLPVSPPSSTEKKPSRAERSLAREKATKSSIEKVNPTVNNKASKSDKNQTKKAANKKEKKKIKADKIVEVKTEKKLDKKKGKGAAAPVASSSKKADKVKKTIVADSEKRTVSTRNKGRK